MMYSSSSTLSQHMWPHCGGLPTPSLITPSLITASLHCGLIAVQSEVNTATRVRPVPVYGSRPCAAL